VADRQSTILTEDEAARDLRLSKRTLQRLRLEGGGPRFVQLTEKRVGYRPADLDDWANARARASTAAA
jgi:predicted DNA-binding transcriptional regulator AlpA